VGANAEVGPVATDEVGRGHRPYEGSTFGDSGAAGGVPDLAAMSEIVMTHLSQCRSHPPRRPQQPRVTGDMPITGRSEAEPAVAAQAPWSYRDPLELGGRGGAAQDGEVASKGRRKESGICKG
jgi:hypothetical protein